MLFSGRFSHPKVCPLEEYVWGWGGGEDNRRSLFY